MAYIICGKNIKQSYMHIIRIDHGGRSDAEKHLRKYNSKYFKFIKI